MNNVEYRAVMTRIREQLAIVEIGLIDWHAQLVEGTLSSGESAALQQSINMLELTLVEVQDATAQIPLIRIVEPQNRP